jgi:hypothetical protein
MILINAARYFEARAGHYKRLAGETANEALKTAYAAIAADMLRKAATVELGIPNADLAPPLSVYTAAAIARAFGCTSPTSGMIFVSPRADAGPHCSDRRH